MKIQHLFNSNNYNFRGMTKEESEVKPENSSMPPEKTLIIPPTEFVISYLYNHTNKIQKLNIPWVTDPVLQQALSRLADVKFLPEDVQALQDMGVNKIFDSGEEALKLLMDKKLKIEFGPLSTPKAHAQWVNSENTVLINEKYRGTKNLAEILAISEAIMHEIGHAKDGDDNSSIQEELDCLALNTLANRYHQQKYPDIYNNNSDSAIINDGVALYTKLFFDSDPKKTALMARIAEKYGDLPVESPNHSASKFAYDIKNNYQNSTSNK